MGIHGIYKEIGPGARIALSKFAVRKFEETGRPLRIAIDTSIWLFQIQSGKGGTNPALRTFYYRLLRLINHSVHPLFVFDGPNRPPFKRHKRTGANVASIPEFLAKQLLKQFGFPIHLAPGEAEAECAVLQTKGVVDAVLSEDVDTLMFGSGVTLRNWSPEDKTNKVPTHVNLYDAVKTTELSGLDREGMILVALMSGGDYVPEGIPGCGPKLACEAARAGFGHDLCTLEMNDPKSISSWRDRLLHELRTNESKFFRTKHVSLQIPEDFPRRDILGYYTHPVVSSGQAISRLERSISWDRDLDFPALRDFCKDCFDWVNIGGAKKFIRNLAPAMLVTQLRLRARSGEEVSTNIGDVQKDEKKLVVSLHGRRNHASTDCLPELRVAYRPLDLVPIDLDSEPPDDEVPDDADLDEEGIDEAQDGAVGDASNAPRKRAFNFDPDAVQKIWISETFLKVGAPLTVQDWEESVRAKAARTNGANAKNPSGSKRPRAVNAPGVNNATIDRFTKVMKPGLPNRGLSKDRGRLAEIPPHCASPPTKAPSPPKARFRAPSDLLASNSSRVADTIDLCSSPVQDSEIRSAEREACIPKELPSSVNTRRRNRSALPYRRQHLRAAAPAPMEPTSDEQLQQSIQDGNYSPNLPSPDSIFSIRPREATPEFSVPSSDVRTPTILETPRRYRQPRIDGFLSPSPRKLSQPGTHLFVAPANADAPSDGPVKASYTTNRPIPSQGALTGHSNSLLLDMVDLTETDEILWEPLPKAVIAPKQTDKVHGHFKPARSLQVGAFQQSQHACIVEAQAPELSKRVARVRDSLVGSWAYTSVDCVDLTRGLEPVNLDSSSFSTVHASSKKGCVGRGRQKKGNWYRESIVDVVDMTGE